ncbi:MAG: NUDIX hydrolase [Candidatus Kapaibacterium sp.]|nr:MAG: NUDIX hydrolase [Candidatus Kapabacteria bacterium]
MRISPWETLQRSLTADLRIFSAYNVQRKHPKTGALGDFTLLDSAEWVNILPLTADNNVVMVRQYRHGTDAITLELPGGLVERGENPLHAGMRECREETGYAAGEDAVLLGVNEPNPAFMNNRCHSFLWRNCSLQQGQSLDEFEDIEVVVLPLAEIPSRILAGEIQHSLVLTAFFFYFLRQQHDKH